MRAWTAASAILTDYLTLPDYLTPSLRLAFVGLNPGLYSAQHGHYFARPTNRFWPAFSKSRLSTEIRTSLGKEALDAADDAKLLQFGIGFTDVVKVATSNANQLSVDYFRRWAPVLLSELLRYQPSVACFHNAHFNLRQQMEWYDRLRDFIEQVSDRPDT